MKWRKKGILYQPRKSSNWDQLYGILPTPFLFDKDTIRIYFASTDTNRVGYISFIDVRADNPSQILHLQATPSLGPGKPGTFDEHGGNPCSVIQKDGDYFLYYVGYKHTSGSLYEMFAGLATSPDGKTFERYSTSSILERDAGESSLRSAPFVLYDNGRYRMWYVSSTRWENIGGIFGGRFMPVYHIRHTTSADGISWSRESVACIEAQNDDEFGFGRPWVVKDGNMYKMWYSVRRKSISYRLGYAESADGITWNRKDNETGIDVSEEGWDSEMICYSAEITAGDRTFLFYNGNRNGETGFGWAERVS